MDKAEIIVLVLRYWAQHPMHYDDLPDEIQREIREISAEYDKRKSEPMTSFSVAHNYSAMAWVRKILEQKEDA